MLALVDVLESDVKAALAGAGGRNRPFCHGQRAS